MPLGAVMFLQKPRQHVFGEAQIFEHERDAARVEHANHGLLAAVGRETC